MMQSPAEDRQISMRSALSNMAATLGELEQLAKDIDMSVADLVMKNQGTATPDYGMLQKVDLLFQSLTALQRVTANLVGFGSPDATIGRDDLVAGVLLQAIRESCTNDGKGPITATHTEGEGSHDDLWGAPTDHPYRGAATLPSAVPTGST